MRCTDLEAVAPDLALGLLSGDERAAAVAHLDACGACRTMVEELSVTVDLIGSMAPPGEPSVGFEDRVLARFDAESRWTRSRRPNIVLIAAAVVIGALIVGGAVLLRPQGESSKEVASFTMRTPSGQEVGEAYLHQGPSTWVFVDVPGWSAPNQPAPGTFALRVTADDGHTLVVPGDFEAGGGGWGTVIGVDASNVRQLALVDNTGHVWCSAAVPA
ncbi:MAG TPA: hypothetical protein VGJ03_07525 [Acidimicrobiales bacterium]|jgi:hypothetical protein